MRLSGTITVAGHGTITVPDLITVSQSYNLTGYTIIRETRWSEERRYNWTPWCVVETDHRHYLEIQTIEHIDNSYSSGTRRLPYDRATFNHWKYIFTGELEPVTLPTLSAMRQQ